MKIERLYFTVESPCDGLALSAIMTKPENPKALVQISHGMCEHKERYLPFIRFLNENGFACIIHDHRGHGKSVRGYDDLGYFYENGADSLVEDIYAVTEYGKNSLPGLKVFLLGHSMGSLGARCYLKENDKELSGLFVCGSPSNNPWGRFGNMFDDYLIKAHGDHGRSVVVNNVFVNALQRNFRKDNIPNSWICSDLDVVHEYNEDPLCNFSFTFNGYKALLELLSKTYSNDGWKVQNPHLPIRFLSGRNDPCMVNEKLFISSIEHLKAMGYENITYRIFEDMRHEIINEKGKEAVYSDILDTLNLWLNE